MAAKYQALRLIYDIRIPIIAVMGLIAISIANSRFGWEPHPSPAISVGYFIVRVVLVATAGYIATSRTRLGLWGAAIAGGLVFLAENLVIAGWFVSIQDWPDVGRLAQTFVIVVWIALAIGVVGGLFGRRR